MTTLFLILALLATVEVIGHHVEGGRVYLVLHEQNRC